MKFPILIAFLCLTGCREVHGKLNIAQELPINNGRSQAIAAGAYDISIKWSDSTSSQASIKLFRPDSFIILDEFDITLPPADDFLHILNPITLSSSELEQPFDLVVIRKVDIDYDQIGVTFKAPDSEDDIYATAQFDHRSTRIAFDEKSQSFLRSYQKVKYSQRGLMFPIDGALGSDFLNDVVNFAGKLLIAPWVYARYSHIEWVLNAGEADQLIKKRWIRLIEKYPVVDYFAFVHGGTDDRIIKPLSEVPKKEHQLRFAYSEGCGGGSQFEYIENYNTAVSAGHKGTSASPLFAFPLVRQWAYGESAQESVKRGYAQGTQTARIIQHTPLAYLWNKFVKGYWTSTDDMLESSEPMLAWTPDLPPSKLYVGLSAVVNRESLIQKSVHESTIRQLEALSEGTVVSLLK